MNKTRKKDLDRMLDISLKRAKNTYNWIAGARKSLEKEKKKRSRDTSLVEDTKRRHNTDINTHTLSQLVNKFYNLLNQPKTSRHKNIKTERTLQCIKELIDDGFTLRDIEFAIDWTVKNKQHVYSFGIISETIGQALAEKEKLTTQNLSQQKEIEAIREQQ